MVAEFFWDSWKMAPPQWSYIFNKSILKDFKSTFCITFLVPDIILIFVIHVQQYDKCKQMNMSLPLQILNWKRFRELSTYLQDFLWHPMVNSSMYDVYKNWLMAEKSSRPNLLITGSATVSLTTYTGKLWQ